METVPYDVQYCEGTCCGYKITHLKPPNQSLTLTGHLPQKEVTLWGRLDPAVLDKIAQYKLPQLPLPVSLDQEPKETGQTTLNYNYCLVKTAHYTEGEPRRNHNLTVFLVIGLQESTKLTTAVKF